MKRVVRIDRFEDDYGAIGNSATDIGVDLMDPGGGHRAKIRLILGGGEY